MYCIHKHDVCMMDISTKLCIGRPHQNIFSSRVFSHDIINVPKSHVKCLECKHTLCLMRQNELP